MLPLRPPLRSFNAALLGTLALLAGCFGESRFQVGGPPRSNAEGAPSEVVADPTVQLPPAVDGCVGAAIDPGPSPLRRLSRAEYNRVTRDLLGDTRNLADQFPPDSQALGFDNNADALTVSPVLSEQYLHAAESLAAQADLTRLLPCTGVTGADQACADRFVDQVGRRFYRRPLDPDERATLQGIYSWASGQSYDLSGALRLVLSAMLQSPAFLYRLELDPQLSGAVRRLDPYELASRLSFSLLGTTPDDALLAAAEAGELETAGGVAGWARKLIGDPRAHQVIEGFTRQWLKLGALDQVSKAASLFSGFDALRPSMRAETGRFLEAIFWEEGDASKLWKAPYTFVDGALASHYRIAGPTGSGLVKVSVDPSVRAGFLTQASFLAGFSGPDQTQPVQRGKFVREQLLCQQLLPPPPNVPAPPDLGATASMRERLAQHTQSAACAGCHVLMDPIGLGFERYDAVGGFQTGNAQGVIDDSGEVVSGGDASGKFFGAAQLSAQLAGSKAVGHCLATQWFRFGLGRGDAPADKCAVQRLQAAFDQAHLDPRELMVALTQTDAFLYRRAAP